MTAWDEWRTLVREGTAESALDHVTVFLKGRLDGPFARRARDLLDTVILIGAQERRLVTDTMNRVLTASEIEARRAQLAQSVLGLIGEVERIDKARAPVINIEVPDRFLAEKLMGEESQLRSVGWLSEGLRLASAVCRLTDGATFGTGFRCRNDAVVTNHHVIEGKDAAARFRAEFFFEEDASRKMRQPVPVALDPGRLFWTSKDLDVTIVGLAPVSRDDIAVISLADGAIPKVNERVSIIQHPSGGPKQIAVTNNRIVNLNERYVHYMTDTLPGSSGSPVFADSWGVVAIHHAGGHVRKNARGDVIFANEGVLVSAIFADAGFRAAYSAGI